MEYIGTGRSNYVKIKNEKKWKQLCEKYGLEFLKNKEGQFGFHASNEDGQVVTSDYDEGLDEETQFPDFMEAFSELIEDEEVLVWMHVGSEGVRYLMSEAIAINNKKEKVSINLTDIYKKSKKLGKNITTVSM
jgi:hypothetical protein